MVNRRLFLVPSGPLISSLYSVRVPLFAAPKFLKDPFSLGVASGDPTASGIVLGTRLAPDPLNGGGMEHAAVEVAWRIAEDEKLSKGVKKGKAVATPNLGHSVHVKVEGLRADRPGGTDADNASGGGDRREVELRVRFVSARGGGIVDGVPA